MVMSECQGIPLGSSIASASPHEITMVDIRVLAQIKVPTKGSERPIINLNFRVRIFAKMASYFLKRITLIYFPGISGRKKLF